jgi:hypothetical protein
MQDLEIIYEARFSLRGGGFGRWVECEVDGRAKMTFGFCMIWMANELLS